MSSEHGERRLATILAADVAGYSRLMGAEEEGTLADLSPFKKTLVDPRIAEHRGHRQDHRALRSLSETFAGIAGPQKYSGKNMANSHGSLPVFV